MAQKLLLPFKRQQIICGYKTKAYLDAWLFNHFGIDISSHQGYSSATEQTNDHTIYASGEGLVVLCEKDIPSAGQKSLGMALAIQYNGCVSRGGDTKDLVVRYIHCKDVLVKLGDRVTKNTPIAIEGAEGTMSYHLHFEVDTDINYPKYSPQVANGHSGWVHGIDTTLNPSLWLFQSADRIQDPYSFTNRAWINESTDVNLPMIAGTTTQPTDEIERLKAENKSLKVKIVQLEEKLASITKAIEDIISKYS